MSKIFNKVAPPLRFELSVSLRHPSIIKPDGYPDMLRVARVLTLMAKGIAEQVHEKGGEVLHSATLDSNGTPIAWWVIHTQEQEN